MLLTFLIIPGIMAHVAHHFFKIIYQGKFRIKTKCAAREMKLRADASNRKRFYLANCLQNQSNLYLVTLAMVSLKMF